MGWGADRKEKKNKGELGQGPRNVCVSATNFLLFPQGGEENEGKMPRTSLNQIKGLMFGAWAWVAPCGGFWLLFVAHESDFVMLISGPRCDGGRSRGAQQKVLEQGQPGWALGKADISLGCSGQ